MRRPAVFFAGSFGAGIVVAFIMDADPLIWMIAVTITLIFVISAFLKKNVISKGGLVLCFLAVGGLWFGASEVVEDPLTEMAGNSVTLNGVVREADIDEEACTLVIESLNPSKSIVKYYGNCEYLSDCAGKNVQIYGTVELPQTRRNPGCFDYDLYLKSCGIRTIIKAKSINFIEGKEIRYLCWTNNIKKSFRDRIEEYVDEHKCGLIMAVMFGDKTMLDEELYEDFQKNGTAHVLAVSGLHTGIIYAFFLFLWRGRKGPVFYLISLVLLFLYTSLAEFSPSVVRAACMILLHSLSGLLKCRYDLLTAASVTFTAMLINNPYQLFNTGFQLSFLAIISLAIIIPFVQRFYQGVFLSAIAIQAGMVPYNAFIFNYVSLGSVIANIPVIFIAGIILPVGLCALAAVNVSGELFGFIITVMDLGCDLLIGINQLFYLSGKTSFDVISPPVWSMIVYYGLLFFLLSETGQLMIMRKNKRQLAGVILFIVVLAMISIPVFKTDFDKAGIVFVDVGQGDCIHIKTESGKNYLIDGGGSKDYDTGMKVLKPYLLKNGVSKIDTAFVTHLHEDHYGGIRSLAADGMIDTVAVYEMNRLNQDEFKADYKSELVYVHRGYRISLDEETYVDILYPEGKSEEEYEKMIADEEDENKSSLIMKVNYRGLTVLITGDIDEDGEQELIKTCGEDLSCDIIKVPHHGSKYSSSEDFLAIADPELAVFQVGRNNYGHPSDEALGRYDDIGCKTVRNDKSGAVGIVIKEKELMEVVEMIH